MWAGCAGNEGVLERGEELFTEVQVGEGGTKKRGLLCKSVFWESPSPSGHGEVSSWFKS